MMNELRKQKERTIYAVTNRQKALLLRREDVKTAWRTVAPQLVEVVSYVLPRGVIKVKTGNTEFAITGTPDGGYSVSLDSNMSLKIIDGQVQYIEKDPNYAKIIFGKGVCEPMAVVERGSLLFAYLVLNWKTLYPLFIKTIQENLHFWETLQ